LSNLAFLILSREFSLVNAPSMQLHNFPGFAAAVSICLSVTRSDITKEITQR
jgi:hypothetical protein